MPEPSQQRRGPLLLPNDLDPCTQGEMAREHRGAWAVTLGPDGTEPLAPSALQGHQAEFVHTQESACHQALLDTPSRPLIPGCHPGAPERCGPGNQDPVAAPRRFDAAPNTEMRLPRPNRPNYHHVFALLQVVPPGQFQHLGPCPPVARRPLTVIQRLPLRAPRRLEAEGRRGRGPRVPLALQQCLQVLLVRPAASAGVPGQGGIFLAARRPLPDLHVVVHDGVAWRLTPPTPPANKQAESRAFPASTAEPAHGSGPGIRVGRASAASRSGPVWRAGRSLCLPCVSAVVPAPSPWATIAAPSWATTRAAARAPGVRVHRGPRVGEGAPRSGRRSGAT